MSNFKFPNQKQLTKEQQRILNEKIQLLFLVEQEQAKQLSQFIDILKIGKIIISNLF